RVAAPPPGIVARPGYGVRGASGLDLARADPENRRRAARHPSLPPRVGGGGPAPRRVRAGGRGRSGRGGRGGGGLNQTWKDRGREIFRPAGRFLAARRVSPDHLTILGVCLSLLAALLLGRGSFFAAGFVLLLAGLCDILDGDV